MLPKHIKYQLYKPYRTEVGKLEYELIGSYSTIKEAQGVYGEIIEREFPNVEKVLLEMERDHPWDDNGEWGSKIRSTNGTVPLYAKNYQYQDFSSQPRDFIQE